MKLIFILLFSLSLNSFAQTIFKGYCVESWYVNELTTIMVKQSNGINRSTNYTDDKIAELRDNENMFFYDADNDYCVPNSQTDSYYGLSQYDYNYLMSLLAVLWSGCIIIALILAV